MLQEHGLGARPYDCSKCTLKFFFRAELDHHMLTFHRPGELSPPSENAQKAKDSEERNCDDGVTVKEEIVPEVADEEEEINVDEQVELEDRDGDKQSEGNAGKKLKTEIEGEIVPEKMES